MRDAYAVRMQLRDLHWLVTLADTGHMTDAAAALGTSQPTLSRAVARAEAEVGAALFVRTSAGTFTTSLGDEVVAAARDVTERWGRLVDQVALDLDPDAGVVRLAFLDSLAAFLVPRLLGRFRAAAPRVRVLLRQIPTHVIAAELAEGRHDVAMTTRPASADWGWLPLHTEQVVLAVAPTHRLARRRRVSITDVADDEFIVNPAGFGFRQLVDALLADAGVTPTVSFESVDLATIEGLVAAGLGVALLPEHVAAQTGSVALPLTDHQVRRTVGLTWLDDDTLTGPARRLLEVAATAADDGTWNTASRTTVPVDESSTTLETP